ncbi:hypothetical protein Q5P01_010466 [Channa striata]|uniref:Uncharacterized protein n=1 Tax=Channa striata TaxID=64152 RepID=A0AA88SYD8_CHASR|nr:hypothetical protein Q5P01_010466 [Channa striata]
MFHISSSRGPSTETGRKEESRDPSQQQQQRRRRLRLLLNFRGSISAPSTRTSAFFQRHRRFLFEPETYGGIKPTALSGGRKRNTRIVPSPQDRSP